MTRRNRAAAKGTRMIEQTIKVDRMEHIISVFGSFDQNLRIIETELGVKVLDRDDMIHICGEPEDVMLAEKAINGLLALQAARPSPPCLPERCRKAGKGEAPQRRASPAGQTAPVYRHYNYV